MPRLPVMRISLNNAALLSGLYLAVGTVVEVVRRAFNARWAEALSLSMEAFPARLLDWCGLLEPVRQAYAAETVSPTLVRLLYGSVTVAVIFATGVLVGGLMWAATRVLGPKAR
jgi:hypothetical protein